jgi:hypothetical protein
LTGWFFLKGKQRRAAEIEPAIDVFAAEPNGGLVRVPPFLTDRCANW